MTVLEKVLAETREAKTSCRAELEEVRARAGVLEEQVATLEDVERQLAEVTEGAPPPAAVAAPKPRRQPKSKRAPAARPAAPQPAAAPAGERIVAVLTHRDQATARQLAEDLGDISPSGVTQACKGLVANGQLATVNPPKRGTETVYLLPDRQASPASEPEAAGDDVVAEEDPPAEPAPENVTPITEAPGAAPAAAGDGPDETALDLTPTQRRLLGLLDSYNWDPPRIAMNTGMRLDQVKLELRKLSALRLIVEQDDGTYRSDRGQRALVRRGAVA